ncbi:hypothetical protein [Phocaeicola dorei]|uniref:hypothetical protein n=1 Tax=Phocaeicola dorei TaxID=357276 RepID=UPI001F4228C0|nr:hypothetical protein [Phocaeicola dorei]MCE9219331.1 hypothetical protein [Phocaeicola dorei]
MKRKSIYKILWRALLLCLAWRFTSVAGAGTAITAYIVFRAACFLLRVYFSYDVYPDYLTVNGENCQSWARRNKKELPDV